MTSYIGRSGCAACDRNEAEYQSRRINRRIIELRAREASLTY